jgi:hypothetical protein
MFLWNMVAFSILHSIIFQKVPEVFIKQKGCRNYLDILDTSHINIKNVFRNHGRQTCVTNSTLPDLGLNLDCHSGWQMANCLR